MRPKLKKPTFDALLKALAMFVLFLASILGIAFGSISAVDKASQGAAYDGTVSVKVYFSPYVNKDDEAATRDFDFSQKRDAADTAELTPEQIQTMLAAASTVYADRMSAQGYEQVAVTPNDADPDAKYDLIQTYGSDGSSDAGGYYVNDNVSSWLVNGTMPSLTVTVNRPNPGDRPDASNANDRKLAKYDAKSIREAIFAVARDYGLELQTTDGYSVLSSRDQTDRAVRFAAGSAAATAPSAASDASSLTLDLTTPSTWNTADGQQALTDIEQTIRDAGGTNSDYFTGDGRSSVDAGANALFDPATGTDATTDGNRNLVLWSDKEGALQYAR